MLVKISSTWCYSVVYGMDGYVYNKTNDKTDDENLFIIFFVFKSINLKKNLLRLSRV